MDQLNFEQTLLLSDITEELNVKQCRYETSAHLNKLITFYYDETVKHEAGVLVSRKSKSKS